MNLIVILGLALATAQSTNADKSLIDQPVSGGYEISQNSTVKAPKDTDSIVTGGTNADTISNWERRRNERDNCKSCEEVNPYPLDLKN